MAEAAASKQIDISRSSDQTLNVWHASRPNVICGDREIECHQMGFFNRVNINLSHIWFHNRGLFIKRKHWPMGCFGLCCVFPFPQIQHDNQESEGNVALFWSSTRVNKWDYVNVSEGLTPRSSQWKICSGDDEAIPPWHQRAAPRNSRSNSTCGIRRV